METDKLLQGFKRLEVESSFISNNFVKLQEQFADCFIAIEGSKVIDFAKSFQELSSNLQMKGKKLNEVLIDFIPRKGIIVLY